MIRTLTTSEAAYELRQDEHADWSRRGALALVEYLESLEEDSGRPMEFCPVEIRCHYSEYESAMDAAKEHGYQPEQEDGTIFEEQDALNWLENRTQVITFDGGVIVESF